MRERDREKERERERERERKNISRRMQVQTQRRRRRCERGGIRIRRRTIKSRPTRGSEGPEEGGSRRGSKPPPDSQPQLHIIERPESSLNFGSRPLFPATLPCGFPSGIIREYVDDDVSCNRNEVPLAFDHHELMGGSI